MKKTVRNFILICILAFAAVSLFPQEEAWAAGEKVHFGSESYEWEVGEENPIGIYTEADNEIDSFLYKVTYDPDVLEYISGGVVLNDHEIEVRVNNVDDNYYVLYLYFKPLTAEATSIKVSDVHIVDSEGNEKTASDITVDVNGPSEPFGMLDSISINGEKIPGFQKDKLEYSIYVKSDITEAEIQTSPVDVDVEVSDTVLKEGSNEIRISCTDQDGNETIYKLKVYRLKPEVTEEETIDQNEETNIRAKILSGISSFGSLRVIAGVLLFLIALFIILCCIRIYIIRNRRYRASKRHRYMEAEKSNESFQSSQEIFNLGETKEDEKREKCDEELEICVSGVTMDFKREKDESSSIKELVIRTLKRQRTIESFRALDNISFDVKKGEVVGIIGTNGSGKSTILKIISGALIPSKGKVKVDRRKIQLLTLGTGFDMELTGRENIYLNGAIIGYTKEYIDEKFDDIVQFAELEGFMDERVKNYSSGMVSRLGFAIATCRETPEILILDEVLSVGDMFFRKKSEERIQEMIHGGSTVLIVSHSTSVIRKNCTKVVWIERGKLRMVGEPQEVCAAYEKMDT